MLGKIQTPALEQPIEKFKLTNSEFRKAPEVVKLALRYIRDEFKEFEDLYELRELMFKHLKQMSSSTRT